MSGRHSLDDTMRLLSCMTQDGGSAAGSAIISDALSWLETLKSKLDSVKAVEYEIRPMTRYMLYNTHTISESEADKILRRDMQDEDRRVVDLSQTQAFSLFPDLRPDGVKDGGACTDAFSLAIRKCPLCGGPLKENAFPGPYDGEEDRCG